jgi:hypothetical protein
LILSGWALYDIEQKLEICITGLSGSLFTTFTRFGRWFLFSQRLFCYHKP